MRFRRTIMTSLLLSKNRTAAGRLAFEKAWDEAVKEKRTIRKGDVERILKERFNDAPGWEYIMGDLTQEQINKELFDFVFEVSLIEGIRKDSVHKIREIFNEDRTTVWYLISAETTPDVKGLSSTEFDVGDEVIVVTYHKTKKQFCGTAFEFSFALSKPNIRIMQK